MWFRDFVRLLRDEDGAALVEYTVLIGLFLVAVMVSILAVGNWVGRMWTTVLGLLP